MNKISDQDLKLEDIPPNNDFKQAAQFAHSVDYLNSFEQMAKVSKNVKERIAKDETDELGLGELRISLFFYFRSIRHTGAEPNLELINKHLDLIRLQLTIR